VVVAAHAVAMAATVVAAATVGDSLFN
jgi:hypothetical protein